MDPLRSFHPPRSATPSLICVGGMLRVADNPPPNITLSPSPGSQSDGPTPTHQYRNGSTSCRTPNITPFKSLVSPFTVTAPFTVPSTPYSHPAVTPIPIRLSPSESSTNLKGNSPEAPSSRLSANPSNHNRVNTFQRDAQVSAQHLLTPKQVRELRRLCRKTANRAEFEDRLIQIRQVASIAAMASSSMHLFDPENSQSGRALRLWVEAHRAEGADWRDERPLSDAAVDELRRWDRLLKAWARVRFEKLNACESDIRPPSVCSTSGSDIVEAVLHPVRLQFEQLSVGSSPITPLSRGKHAGTGEGRAAECMSIAHITSPTTPDEQGSSFARSPHAVVGDINMSLRKSQRAARVRYANSGRNAVHMVQSAWSKLSPSVMKGCVRQREPLAEVSINKTGDLINVTVPRMNTSQNSSSSLRGFPKSSSCGVNTSVACDEENILGIGQMKSWRNVLLESTKSRSGVDGNASTKHPPSYGENGFYSHQYDCVDMHSLIPTHRTDLDWGRLRGGEGSESSFLSRNGNNVRD